MNAKELQAGDWLYAIDEDGNRHLCRANKIEIDYVNNTDDFCVDFYGTDYEAEWPDVTFKAEPIPITKEILEKNEWKCYNTYQMYSCSNVPFDLRAQKDGGFTVEVAADEYGSSTFMFIQYVHQFQHLLKLVGYEKEITL